MSPRIVFDFPLDGTWDSGPLSFGRPETILCADSLDDVSVVLDEASRLADAGMWVAGFVAYEAAPAFDRSFEVRSRVSELPYAWFGAFPDPIQLPQLPSLDDPETGRWSPETSASDFERDIASILAGIRSGDFYQVNHTIRLNGEVSGNPYAWFQRLARAQPKSYAAYLDIGSHNIVSLSPELFFRRDGNVITTRPMKGTWQRGRWAAEDEIRAEELRNSEKNRAENLMIVDLLRNDLTKLSRPFGVNVNSLFQVERYASLLQMTSTVSAQVAEHVSLNDIFRALFPCGSVTGTPKVAAMSAIAKLERSPRGVYCGAIGLLKPGGDSIFNVGIRTVLCEKNGSKAICGVGSGITVDSDPQDEYREVLLKSRFLEAEFDAFSLIETMRIANGKVCRLDIHVRRLVQSAHYFQIEFDEALFQKELFQLIKKRGGEDSRLKVTLSRSGQWGFELHELPRTTTKPKFVRLALHPVSSSSIWLFHKTTHREWHGDAWTGIDPSVFDVLMWNEREEITEFTRGNVIFEINGRRITPPQSSGLLNGCLRQELLDAGQIVEQVVTVGEACKASRLWFINSLRGEIEVEISVEAALLEV